MRQAAFILSGERIEQGFAAQDKQIEQGFVAQDERIEERFPQIERLLTKQTSVILQAVDEKQ